MPDRVRRLLAAATLVLPASLAAPDVSAQQAQAGRQFKARIGLYYAGLIVYSATIAGRVGPRAYRISYKARTRGIAAVFVTSRTNNRVIGVLENGRFMPRAYRGRLDWRSKQYWVDISYNGAMEPRAKHTPTLAKRGRVEMSRELSRGAIDPISALIEGLTRPAQRPPCAEPIRIFDGNFLFRLHYRNLGAETIKSDGFSNYAGTAVKCAVRYEKLAENPVVPKQGAATKPAAPATKKTTKKKKPGETFVWFMHNREDRVWMPVRVQGSSKWGKIHGALLEFEVSKAGAKTPR